LLRAIASVHAQEYSGRIVHSIAIDDCAESAQALGGLPCPPRREVVAHFKRRLPGEIPDGPVGRDIIYPRLSRLMNAVVRMANSRWIAFLDDDNEFESNHISSLVQCALRNNGAAVHSSRRIFYADGMPYLEPRFPWARKPEDAGPIYESMCVRGVWVRNTNILHDRAGPPGLTPFVNSTILAPLNPVCMVDTSVWLLERDLLLKYPIPEHYSAQDLHDNMAPDDQFLELLMKNKVPIISSGLPTLRYYLGGISNEA
jgi:hypothetical protein